MWNRSLSDTHVVFGGAISMSPKNLQNTCRIDASFSRSLHIKQACLTSNGILFVK